MSSQAEQPANNRESSVGITFRETMSGGFALGETDPQTGERKGKDADTVLSMHSTIDIRDLNRFIADPDHTASMTGHINFAPFGENITAKSGVFNLFFPSDSPNLKFMIYELAFEHEGQDYYLVGNKEVRDDPGFDLWKDTTTLYTQLHKGADKTGPVVGAGILSLGPVELMRLVSTMRATNAKSIREQTEAVLEFGRFFMGELWDTYARRVAAATSWWRRWWRRLFGAR